MVDIAEPYETYRDSEEEEHDGFVLLPPTPPDLNSADAFPEIADQSGVMVPNVVPIEHLSGCSSFASVAAVASAPAQAPIELDAPRRPCMVERRLRRVAHLYSPCASAALSPSWSLADDAGDTAVIDTLGALFSAAENPAQDAGFVFKSSLAAQSAGGAAMLSLEKCISRAVFFELCVYAADARLGNVHASSDEVAVQAVELLLGPEYDDTILIHTTGKGKKLKNGVPSAVQALLKLAPESVAWVPRPSRELATPARITEIASTVLPRPSSEESVTDGPTSQKDRTVAGVATRRHRKKRTEGNNVEKSEAKIEPTPRQRESSMNAFAALDSTEVSESSSQDVDVELKEKRKGNNKKNKNKAKNTQPKGNNDNKVIAQQGSRPSLDQLLCVTIAATSILFVATAGIAVAIWGA